MVDTRQAGNREEPRSLILEAENPSAFDAEVGHGSNIMSRVFITGSADGLGMAAAQALISEGHEVVVHARSTNRAAVFEPIQDKLLGIVTGDLSSDTETRSIADQINRIGTMDAVIHNAGIYLERERGNTPECHAKILAVNVLAPYLLTALIERPGRLIYLSSGMHQGGSSNLDDIDWAKRTWSAGQAYSESKLYVAALSSAISAWWPDVITGSVNPGWVPTRMGGASAPDDLEMGHQTQTWLAASDEVTKRESGQYWYHRQPVRAAQEVTDTVFQKKLINKLEQLTGMVLPK